MKKKKTDQILPHLCAAVKRLREAYGDSQERFARRIEVALMTVSRFETGRAEPRDPRVLWSLAKAAKEIRLVDEYDLFAGAHLEAANPGYFVGSYGPNSARDFLAAAVGISRKARDLEAWRLSAAARMAALYYPEQVAALEKALGPALAIVDEALRTADLTRGLDYKQLEDRLEALGEQKLLADLDMKLKKEKKED